MRYLQADALYPIHQLPMYDQVLIVHDDGTIEGIAAEDSIDPLLIERHTGILTPGFINTHCHLELSHLRGRFPEKTGLPGFLMNVTQKRGDAPDPDFVQQAMIDADAEMYRAGIVAVGDISNNALSFPVKSQSKLWYHTFIELFALNPARAPELIQAGNALLQEAAEYHIRASLAPHAPYSINEQLVRGIMEQCIASGMPSTVHMLESNDENEFYVRSTGLYRKLYRELQMRFDDYFTPTGKTSLESVLPWFDTRVNTLLVHNTIATAWDADWAEGLHPHLFWCFCPRANLYIEDRLPDILMLMQHVKRITLGTDSLASNHGLSILDEIRVIRSAFPEIDLSQLLRWATLNGAQFLGIDDRFGSFERGKRPGVLLLQTTGGIHNFTLQGAERLT